MHQIIASLIVGAVAGGSARNVSWRPFLRAAIREGVRVQRSLAEFGSRVRAEAKQLVPEAKDDLDRSDHRSSSTQ